jgi:acylglycerol lipase
MIRLRTLTILVAVLLAACTPRLQDPGPDAQMPKPPRLTETSFVTADGTQLPLRRWEPETSPRAVVLALHGFNDYSNAFDAAGTWLAANGVLTLAYDQRGFGGSDQRGIWPGEDTLAGDAHGAVAAVRHAYPGMPVYALGESMGGAVLMRAWDETPLPVDGVILVAPAVWGRITMPFYQTASLWMFAHTMPWLTLTGEGIQRNPSDNVEMLRALGRDPLVIKSTRIDAMWGIVNLMDDALDASERFDAPALLLYGAHDDIVPPAASRAMLDRLPDAAASHRRIAVYDSGFHMLLRDLQGEAVLADILAWIENRDAALPSGADKGDPAARLAGR